MIQLHPDYLVLKTSDGAIIPCSAEEITVELIGDSVSEIDPGLLRQISRAVLHYFQHDLGRSVVSIQEFSSALARVLTRFGFTVEIPEAEDSPDAALASSDLSELVTQSSPALELGFFPKLRDALHHELKQSPRVLRFRGLRTCVKQLIGAKRWGRRCQQLSDQIVSYLRQCFEAEENSASCHLIIR